MKKIETVEQLVEDYLPNYEERLASFIEPLKDNCMSRMTAVRVFSRNSFAEALANYSKELCYEQRIICQDVFDAAYTAERTSDVYYYRKLAHGPTPEFEPIKGER